MDTSIHHRPKGPWEFDGEVTKVFRDMIARSIPDYERMRSTVDSAARMFLPEGGMLVDLGCSHGDAIAGLVGSYTNDTRFIGIEVSEPMIEAARERFMARANVVIEQMDLRQQFPSGQFDTILSVLTLQFTPIEYRARILRHIYANLKPGGAFIFVEKVLGRDAVIDDALVKMYYAIKEENGYGKEEIERKRLSLEGRLVPVTSRMNEEFLSNAGFASHDVIWRCLNFCAWLCVK